MLVLVMKSVTVAPARGAPLKVTVPEIVSGVGGGGFVPPLGELLTPPHAVNADSPTIASNNLHVTIATLSGHSGAMCPPQNPDKKIAIHVREGNRSLSAVCCGTLGVRGCPISRAFSAREA